MAAPAGGPAANLPAGRIPSPSSAPVHPTPATGLASPTPTAGGGWTSTTAPATGTPPSAGAAPVEALLLPLVDKFLKENLGPLHQMQTSPSPWHRPGGCATIDEEMKWLASQNLTERHPGDRPACPAPASAEFPSPTTPYNSGLYPYLLPLQSLQSYLQNQMYGAVQPPLPHLPAAYTTVFAPVPVPASGDLGQYYAPHQPTARSASHLPQPMTQSSCKACSARRHRQHSHGVEFPNVAPALPGNISAGLTPAMADKRSRRIRLGPDQSKARFQLQSRRSAFSEAGSTSSSQRGKGSITDSPRSSGTSGSRLSHPWSGSAAAAGT